MATGPDDRAASRWLSESTAGLLPWGVGGALAACALNGVWLACMIFLEHAGDVSVQASTYPGIFRLSVGSALALTFTQVLIAPTFAAIAAKRDVPRALIGGMFYVLYIPINVVAYFSYGRLMPIVYSSQFAGSSSAALAGSLAQIGHPLGLTGSLPIVGYGVLGLAWCLLSTAVWYKTRIWKVTAVLLFTSGSLSVLGAVGGFIDSAVLVRCCFLGGVVSLPALALLGISMLGDAESPSVIGDPLGPRRAGAGDG